MLCYECGLEHPSHKMGCGSKSRMDTLEWLLSSLHHLPDELLDKVYFQVWSEYQDRKYKDMFPEEE